MDKIDTQNKDELLTPFSLTEIHQVVFGMKRNKSPGLDGFPADFYQDFWEVVKWDLKALVDSFAKGEINIARLNNGIITLVPKTNDAKQTQKFTPICLLNFSFKIITKVLVNRLATCVAPVISRTQTTFIKGRYIMEGIVILHEALNSFHKNKEDAQVFKVDFEKAYDKVKWPFLQQALRMKGFDPAWRNQIDSFTQKGSVGIKVNDDVGHYFQTHKGLRQGDPMSPILFNIVVDMLSI